MNAPPNWFLWLSGILAVIATAGQIWEYWRKRDRIQFNVLNSYQYYTPFDKKDVQLWNYGHVVVKEGDPLHVFAVLEFTLTNNYARAISAGRINIDGWMFGDGYHSKELYDHMRDYHVYDLYTQERTTLERYKLLEPGESMGLRVEAYEHQGSGIIYSQQGRSRLNVEMPKKYKVDIKTDVGHQKHTIHPVRTELPREKMASIFRLSGTELMPIENPSYDVIPQGIVRRYWKPSRKSRLIRYFQGQIYRVKRLISRK